MNWGFDFLWKTAPIRVLGSRTTHLFAPGFLGKETDVWHIMELTTVSHASQYHGEIPMAMEAVGRTMDENLISFYHLRQRSSLVSRLSA